MRAVAVEELEKRPSACLREVRGAEVVLVTDRGRVVESARRCLAAARQVVTSRLARIETRRVIQHAECERRIDATEAADLLAVFARAAST